MRLGTKGAVVAVRFDEGHPVVVPFVSQAEAEECLGEELGRYVLCTEPTLLSALAAVPIGPDGRRGDWKVGYNGKKFYPFDPRPEDIDVRDIVHASSNICRWGGHCHEFFSIAQHMVLVGYVAEELAREANFERPELARIVGHLHDAHEAYKGDTVTPIKKHLPLIVVENLLDAAIFDKLGITSEQLKAVAPFVMKADRILLATEKRDLTNSTSWHLWDARAEPLPDTVRPLDPRPARELYRAALVQDGIL